MSGPDIFVAKTESVAGVCAQHRIKHNTSESVNDLTQKQMQAYKKTITANKGDMIKNDET